MRLGIVGKLKMRLKQEGIAKKILQEKRPGQQKFLGDHVKGFVEKIWKDCCQEVMKTGLQAKFTQNEHLKDYLLSTGNNQLVEGCATLLASRRKLSRTTCMC